MKDITMKNGTIKAVMILAIVCTSLSVAAYGQGGQVALMLQQTPVNGGSVNIGTGVHQFEEGSQVSLVATPNPGYQFVYWLGDVSDSTSPTTFASASSPKIVIAVYERVEFDFPNLELLPKSAPAGGLYRKAADYYTGEPSAPGAKRPSKWSWPNFPREEQENDFPVPGEDGDSNDFPVPPSVPEPATVALLGLGALVMRMGRHSRKN